MKFGHMLSNPTLGGKALLGGGHLFGGEDNSFWTTLKNWLLSDDGIKHTGKAIICFIMVVLLVMVLCWFTCLGPEGMSSVTGDWHGAPPSADTYGFGLLDKYGQRNQNYGDDPMGRPIYKTVGQMGEAVNTALFRKRQAEEGGEEFDPNAIVNEEGFGDIDPEAVQLEELFADSDELSPTWGYAPPRIPLAEGMHNDEPRYNVGGMLYRNKAVLRNPEALPPGYNDWAVARAEMALKSAYAQKDMETMADVGPMATRKVLPIHNVGRGVFGLDDSELEAYSNMKVPRRAKYEHMSGMIPNIKGVGVNYNAASTVKQSGYKDPFPDPMGPIVADLGSGPRFRTSVQRENFGLDASHKKKGYLGNLGSSLPQGSAYYNLASGYGTMPYTGDKAQFTSLFQNKEFAEVIEDQCDEDGRCRISFVGGPGKLGNIIDLVYQLSPSERKEMKYLAGKFSRYQLNSKFRLQSLKKKEALSKNKNSGVKYTALDRDEAKKLAAFIKENGVELDRFEKLTEKAAVKLSQNRYVVPTHTPANACKVPPGLRYYGPSGRLQRISKYVPANSCNYQDYKPLAGVKSYSGLSSEEAVKIGDAINALEQDYTGVNEDRADQIEAELEGQLN